MQELRSEIANLKGETERVRKPVPEPIEYHTDEEELAKETEWILQRKENAKKRKTDTSSTSSTQPTQDQPKQRPTGEAAKPIKPPSIIIYQVSDYETIYSYLNTKLDHNYKIALLNNGDLKLNVDTAYLYRTASKMLTEAQFKWSTYENKQTRPIRVVVKRFHSSYIPEQIVQELRQKGYHILDAVNILKWKLKNPCRYLC
jgi:hypothetical protein